MAVVDGAALLYWCCFSVDVSCAREVSGLAEAALRATEAERALTMKSSAGFVRGEGFLF